MTPDAIRCIVGALVVAFALLWAMSLAAKAQKGN